MGIDLEKSEFKDFIIDRAKSQQEMDTRPDRLAEGFWKKNESSEEIDELEREEYRDAGELAKMSPGGKTMLTRKRNQL